MFSSDGCGDFFTRQTVCLCGVDLLWGGGEVQITRKLARFELVVAQLYLVSVSVEILAKHLLLLLLLLLLSYCLRVPAHLFVPPTGRVLQLSCGKISVHISLKLAM